MEKHEEPIVGCIGSEVFSLPPQVWRRVGEGVRAGVVAWANHNRSRIGEDAYWRALGECGRIIDEMGLNGR